MGKLFVPGVIDLILASEPEEILRLADDPKFDRRFEQKGPLFNRMLAGRIRGALRAGGKPLPSVSPRADPERADAQAALEVRLNAAAAGLAGGADLEALAAYVRGAGPASGAGPLVQQVVGRAFAPDFKADADSWADARVLDAAPRTFNPVLLIYWALTGRVARARDRLFSRTGSGAGVHAAGVAVHNLVKGIVRMRTIWADLALRRDLSPQAVTARCLLAPPQVVRQTTGAGSAVIGPYRDGALALLRLGAAQARLPGPETIFLTDAWSRCPAHAWVPALLTGVWTRAMQDAPP